MSGVPGMQALVRAETRKLASRTSVRLSLGALLLMAIVLPLIMLLISSMLQVSPEAVEKPTGSVTPPPVKMPPTKVSRRVRPVVLWAVARRGTVCPTTRSTWSGPASTTRSVGASLWSVSAACLSSGTPATMLSSPK